MKLVNYLKQQFTRMAEEWYGMSDTFLQQH